MIQLNRKQKDAASFLHGICSVIAVPGSGKTSTMTCRIGFLVKKHGIPPESILGLTFTRNAAQAMRDKLHPVLDDLASRVTLSTIHSFCLSLLRNEGRTFEILSGKEQIRFIRKVMQEMKVRNLSTGMVLREISLAKNNLITVEEFRDLYAGDHTMLKVADIYEAYDKEKKQRMLMDFDDLLVETHELLGTNQDVRERYQETFRHVLVDEFQDSNPAQMEILKLLVGNSRNNESSFWICGDDAQAIYAFTGASVGNILNFKKLFPDAAEYIMNVNYRSTPQILKACENLIGHNLKKIEKSLVPHNQNGDQVIVLDSVNEEDEALIIVNEISDLVDRKSFAYRDIAILYRANFQSRVIEETFLQYKIPYHIENGMNFYQRFEVKVLLDYLRLINDPHSDEGDEALEMVINVPNRYVGRKFVNDLGEYCARKEVHLYQGLKSMRIELPYVRKNLKTFTGLIDALIEESKKIQPAELIQILRETLDYDHFIMEDELPSPDDSKIANVNQLQMVASRYRDIKSLLNYTDTFQEASSEGKEQGVSLMTIHKSKGLEFPVVFLVGLVEGILPTKRGDIEEERRICFVGISRAMKLLYLSHSQMYMGQPAKKSIFLDEMLGTKK